MQTISLFNTKEQKIVNISRYIGYQPVSIQYCEMIVGWSKNRYNIEKIVDILTKYRKMLIFRQNIESIPHARMG